MDAFALSLFYGIEKLSIKKVIITSFLVGVFHFFMPLIGNIVGISIFEYIIIKPKYILFIVFFILSIDMFIHYFEEESKIRKLNLFGMLFFSFSVSIDSFSVGVGINYIYDNILIVITTFSIVSMLFTFFGFNLGDKISEKKGKISFLIGASTLLTYSLIVLTKWLKSASIYGIQTKGGINYAKNN